MQVFTNSMLLHCSEPVTLQAPGSDGTAAEAIIGQLSIARSRKHRSLDISLSYRPEFRGSQRAEEEITLFFELTVSG